MLTPPKKKDEIHLAISGLSRPRLSSFYLLHPTSDLLRVSIRIGFTEWSCLRKITPLDWRFSVWLSPAACFLSCHADEPHFHSRRRHISRVRDFNHFSLWFVKWSFDKNRSISLILDLRHDFYSLYKSTSVLKIHRKYYRSVQTYSDQNNCSQFYNKTPKAISVRNKCNIILYNDNRFRKHEPVSRTHAINLSQ